MRWRRNGQGWTLVELMVVLAVAATLLHAALPSWQAFLRGQRMKAAAALWLASVARARAEALQRGETLTLLPLVPGDWGAGWAVVRDDNANLAIDTGEPRLQVYDGLAPGLEYGFHFAGKPLQFLPSGRPLQPGHVLLQLGPLRRKIVVSMLGRARACDPDAAGTSC